jgi:hypothetical protein
MARGDVVWILGAGFSKPLGGPLLRDLFRQGTIEDIRGRFTEKYLYPTIHKTEGVERVALDAVIWLYDWGKSIGHWDDAEQFLGTLDLATTPHEQLQEARQAEASRLAVPLRAFLESPDVCARYDENYRSLLLGELWTFTRHVSDEARRLMAAQCAAFMLTANDAREDWSPFLGWGRTLTKQHTVLTLNYDCAAERAGGDNLTVVTDADQASARQWERARLFKLHGSTSWTKVQNGGKFQVTPQYGPWACLRMHKDQSVIGSPGPEKRRTAGYLRPLWDGAMQAIREAEVVVFVGYRFPETDSDARQRICEAIGQNQTGWLRLHTVLGPNIQSDASVRLRRLIVSQFNGRKLVRPEDMVDKSEYYVNAGAEGNWYTVTPHTLGSQDLNALGDLFHPSL